MLGRLGRCSLLLAFNLCAPTLVVAQDVIIVDDTAGSGADFATLGAAVAAAGEGDTLLVREGSYDAPAAGIDAKSLAIVADGPPGTVHVQGPLRIRHLSSGQFVSLAGLQCTTGPGAGSVGEGLIISDNLGHVWLEDCRIQPQAGAGADFAGPGLHLENSAHVTLTRCEILGATQPGFTGVGTAGIELYDTHLRAFDTVITGGPNVCDAFGDCPSASAPGLFVFGGSLLLEGSAISAGTPISTCSGSGSCAAAGPGPGMWLVADNPQVVLFDSSFPLADPPIRHDSGTITSLPGVSRDFTVTSPVRSGDPLTLEFTGTPGERAWIFAGVKPADILAPKFKGALLVGEPHLLLRLGVVPASGVFTLSAPAAGFPPAFDSLQVALQPAFVVVGGGAILSDPARLIMLQPSF